MDVDGEVAGEQLGDRRGDDRRRRPFRTFSNGNFGCGVSSSQVPGWMCAGMSGLPAGSTVTSTRVWPPTSLKATVPVTPESFRVSSAIVRGARPRQPGMRRDGGKDREDGDWQAGGHAAPGRSVPERTWEYLVCGSSSVDGSFGTVVVRERPLSVRPSLPGAAAAQPCHRVVGWRVIECLGIRAGPIGPREQVALATLRPEAAQDLVAAPPSRCPRRRCRAAASSSG